MEITDEIIKQAEKIFLGENQKFDEERRNFIKCIDSSLHLQACPGSGKTTALLAKLYILSEKMPFENNQGICVLTHTNVAIDIIKKKLGDKASKLLSYPNFFGTIQSFIDKYLAIPAYIKYFGYRPSFIDTELQSQKMISTNNLESVDNQILNNLKSIHYSNKIFGYYTIEKYNNNFKIIYSNTRKEVNIKKPKAEQDWSQQEKEHIKKAALKLKIKVVKEDKVLTFDDAYDFAKCYLEKYPELKKIFSSRFKYVFIDEAQDTSALQKEIIEKCFNENVIIQWIGDINQGIMNDDFTETAWQPESNERFEKIEFTHSYRLSQPVANIIKSITVNPYEDLIGIQTIELKPILIVFNDNTVNKVLEKYVEILEAKKCVYNNYEENIFEIAYLSGNLIKAVGWVGKERGNGLSIKSYFPEFNKQLTNMRKQYFPNLYTMFELSKNVTPKEFKNRTLSCIIKVLSLVNIKSPKNKSYTKTELIKYIQEQNPNILNFLMESIAKYFVEQNFECFSDCIYKTLKELFNVPNNNKKFKNYFSDKKLILEDKQCQISSEYNVYKPENNNKKLIYIDTVHGVKGETHTATLYLETKYHQNSIEYFIDELLGSSKNNNNYRKKRALKIAHVAFSRPTHLLCIAIHLDQYNKICSDDLCDRFEIIDITNINNQ